MKNYLICSILLFAFGFLSAQTKDTIASQVDSHFYIGIGGLAQSSFNINQKLINSNQATIPNTMSEFIVGFSAFGKKYSGSLELASIYSDRKIGANSTRFMSGTARGNFSYNLVNKEKIAFAAGINLAYTRSDINIYNTNTVIDLNNLNPITNTSNTSLYNNMFYVGPAVSLYLFKHTNWQVRLYAAYEIGLTRGSWKSEFVNVNNTVNEIGNNRFVFGITL